MSNEKPILFTSAMVNAILSGRKTQTRRIIKPQPLSGHLLPFPAHNPQRKVEDMTTRIRPKTKTTGHVMMQCFDEVLAERAKVADLEKELDAVSGYLYCMCVSMERNKVLYLQAAELRRWFGSYRAKPKRESEQKTSGETGRV